MFIHVAIVNKLNSCTSLTFSEGLASPGNKFTVTPIEEMNKVELNACLKSFYTSARKQDGQFYKSSSLKSIRAAIDRYFRWPPHSKKFSIVADPAFAEANKILDPFVKELRKIGKNKWCSAQKSHHQTASRQALPNRGTWSCRRQRSSTVAKNGVVLSRDIFRTAW